MRGIEAKLEGRTLGDFVVKEPLAEGGFGQVYLARQPLLDRSAVIKVLHARHRGRQEMIDRFLREARLASKLAHPFAAHVYAFGAEDDGLLWIAMEYVRGLPLSELLERDGPMALTPFADLLGRLSEVVGAAHELGIVHRDIKPANVIVVTRAGRISPKLLDLGIAKIGAAALERPSSSPPPSTPVTSLTEDEVAMGSPHYMAPEQWLDPGAAGPEADIYALAVLSFRALTGRHPFEGTTVHQVAIAHARNEAPALGDSFPTALDDVLRAALTKDPGERTESATQFARDFRAAAGLSSESGDSGERRPSTGASTDLEDALAPPTRRRPRAAAAVAAVVVLCAAIATIGSMFAREDSAQSATSEPTAPAQPDPEILERALSAIDESIKYAGATDTAIGAHFSAARELQDEGHMPEALEIARRALEMERTVLGAEHPEVGRTEFWVAYLYIRAGNPEAAIVLAKHATRLAEEHASLSDVAEARAVWARAHHASGNVKISLRLGKEAYREALDSANYDLAARIRTYIRNHEMVSEEYRYAIAKFWDAYQHIKAGDPVPAMALAEHSTRIAENHLPLSEIAEHRALLAWANHAAGNIDESLRLSRQAYQEAVDGNDEHLAARIHAYVVSHHGFDWRIRAVRDSNRRLE